MGDTTPALLGPPLHSFSGPTCSLAIWRPAPGVLVTRVVGHMPETRATELAAWFRKQVAEDGRHLGFHDWLGMTDYESRARIVLTETARSLLPEIECVHVLTCSPLVMFGVRAANLILRRVTVHTEQGAFDAELRRGLGNGPSSRRAP